MEYNLTEGSITGKLLKFAFPLMIGNLLQQCYNIADTLIVGRFLGAITLALNFLVVWKLGLIIRLLQIPAEIQGLMRDYLWIIFMGMVATFLYNYFANLLRAVGNSVVPLIFLAFSAVLNILLDLLFVLVFHWGVKGAAGATVFCQYVSGAGIMIYYYVKFPHLRVNKCHMKWDTSILKEITGLSVLTCMQQSIMNLGILMVQGLVNSFGTAVMAAFAAAVKIDSFAYMPVQDFGNAFSTFVAQNYGAGKCDFPWNTCCAGLCAVSCSCYWSKRHLGSSSDRMDSGGSDRSDLYAESYIVYR